MLLFSQFFSSTRGGGEYIFEMIAGGLAARGHEVWVVTNRVRGQVHETHENLHVVQVGPALDYAGGLPPSFADNVRYVIHGIVAGLRIMSSNRINIIHSNNFSPALTGALLSVLYGTRHIITIFDIFSGDDAFLREWTRQQEVSSVNARLVPVFERLLSVLKHHAVFTISSTSRDDMRRIGIKKPIHVISPAVRDGGHLPGASARDPMRFVCIGRLVFYKNLDVVMSAVRQVKATYPGIRLTVIGDGPDRSRLERLASSYGISENVEFAGYLDAESKSEILAGSTALLFPSTHEGFGLVILEAWQKQVPVVVSDVPPMSSIVSDGVTGFVADPHDDTQWAKRIAWAVENPSRLRQMGTAALHELREKYDVDRFYSDIITMYGDVAGPSR